MPDAPSSACTGPRWPRRKKFRKGHSAVKGTSRAGLIPPNYEWAARLDVREGPVARASVVRHIFSSDMPEHGAGGMLFKARPARVVATEVGLVLGTGFLLVRALHMCCIVEPF